MRISSKCSIAAHCLIFIALYGHETRVTSTNLSASSGCNPVVIRGIISSLRKAGFIQQQPGGGAVLACSPSEINLYQLFTAVEPQALDNLVALHPDPSPLCPVGRAIYPLLHHCYDQLRQDLEASMRRITLADLLEDFRTECALSPQPKDEEGEEEK